MLFLSELLLLAYGLVVVLLSFFAFHRLCVAVQALRLRLASPTLSPIDSPPRVLVQVPLYNEPHVAARIIEAVCALEYPRERLTIQILDDSTDETRAIVASEVARFAARGIAIYALSRHDRCGFKAGALAAGLQHDDSEFVAIFDADFIPQPDFLVRLLPDFKDSNVAMVQARWGHLNRGDSPLTMAQAVLLDGHFINEHGARFVGGRFFNFNGTCGIWRRRAIDDAGGWSGRTLTEDLDLSYRAQLRGWRLVFRPDVVVPGELPIDIAAFKAQQHRWAKGSIETARYLLPSIVAQHRLKWSVRLEAMFHLGGNFAYPLVIALAVITPFAILARLNQSHAFGGVFGILDVMMALGSTGSLLTFYCLAALRAGREGFRLAVLPAVLALGVGLAVNNSRAVFEALRGQKSPFARTPKRGDARSYKASEARSWLTWQVVCEVVLGLHLAVGACLALHAQRYVLLPFLTLFSGGFLWLGVGSGLRRLDNPRPVDELVVAQGSQSASIP